MPFLGKGEPRGAGPSDPQHCRKSEGESGARDTARVEPLPSDLGLARFFSSDLPSLTTVAFIPRTVTGNHVVRALACQEIIMRPEAERGGHQSGQAALWPTNRRSSQLVNRRHNRKLSEPGSGKCSIGKKRVLWGS